MIAVFLLASAGVAWVTKNLPTPGALADRTVKESTRIYDRTGTTLLYEIGEVHRTRVRLVDISPYVVKATIATEDRGFYEHRGFAIRGILRALSRVRPKQRLQGGSTITQQLVKNALLTPERTLPRKMREFLLAIAIEQRYTKEEILEMYLNEIPYGANAYGVEAAARQYFGTTAKDLSLAQAALLAALPKAPTYYSPYGSHQEELIARQKWILASMAELGMVTTGEAEMAQHTEFRFPTQRRESILAPHFIFYVRELLEREYGETLVEQGGLKVTTTLDMNFQRAAEDAVSTQAPKNLAFGARNAALVAINPKHGDILAMVGSVDYFDEENDGNVNVAIRMRSPGSSFKPIVYAEAFRKGYTDGTVLADVPIDFAAAGKSYTPKNFDVKFRGPVTMRQALAQSLNVPSVQVLYLAGVHDAISLARRLGFTTLTDPDRYGLSLVLGGGEVRLLDAVSAYGAFATDGVRYPHHAILRVEAPNGHILFNGTEETPKGEVVLEPEITRLVTNILSDNAARAPVFGARSPLQLAERPVAAKTGTAQEFRDGWTLGYTPSLVAGVWVGNNDNTPMKREPGVYTAAPIWNAFMRRVLTGTPIEHFTPPGKVVVGRDVLDGHLPEMTVRYESSTGLVLPASCGVDIGVPRRFVEFHSILHYIQRENPRGDPPTNPGIDPQYGRWEEGVASWREKDNKENPNDEKEYVDLLPKNECDLSVLEGRPTLKWRSPADAVVRKSPMRVAVDVDAPDPVTNVVFFVGEKKIGERTESPWEALYRFRGDTHGEVVLRVRASTAAGKINEIQKKIRINPDNTLPQARVLKPKSTEVISPTFFPYTIQVEALDQSGIGEVSARYAATDRDEQFLIGRATTPSPNQPRLYYVVWESPPAPGTYLLRVEVKDKTGNVTKTTPLTVVIP